MNFVNGCYALFLLLCSVEPFKILILNLPQRIERRERGEKLCKAMNAEHYEFIPGVNGTLIERCNATSIQQCKLGLPADFKADLKEIHHHVKDRVMFRPRDFIGYGGVGCWLSHLKAFHTIIKSNWTEPVVIFEDDFDVHRNLLLYLKTRTSQLPQNWDVLHIGHCGGCRNAINGTSDICRTNIILPCLHGYVLNGAKTAQKLYNYANTPKPHIADLYFQNVKGLERFMTKMIIVTQARSMLRSDIKESGGFRFGLTPKLEFQIS